ncbi:MAG: EMC3/TMCO1 family protein [Halobacteriales archaeon]|nr:EMC3/TMCO1 family protein [Halobacteriales archaeon]
MSEDAQAQAPTKASTKAGLPKTNPVEQFVVFVSFILAFVVLFDQQARAFTGQLAGAVLEPVIGFGHAYPVLTILLASVIMVLVTSWVRHYFTDYLKQARNQETMKAFQKEMRDARKENNLYKMKKLTEMNKDLMSLQAEQSSSQLRPMAITMLVVIPIFAWLLVFVDHGMAANAATTFDCPTRVNVAWEQGWCAAVNIQAVLTFIPRWIALYSLFSIPIGQVVQRWLKTRDLVRELAETGSA